MESVFAEIITGKLKNQGDQEEQGQLQIGVGVEDFYETVPVEDKRGVIAKDKVKHIN